MEEKCRVRGFRGTEYHPLPGNATLTAPRCVHFPGSSPKPQYLGAFIEVSLGPEIELSVIGD